MAATKHKAEKVNSPWHYRGGETFETINVIEAWELGFNLGNAVKYISRVERHGSPLADLRKARWYIDREIQNLQRPREE
jgi:hypothetical protein